MIILERVDSSRNMSRFYALDLQPSLFGDVLLVRRWGRIGSYGQERHDWFGSEDGAAQALEELNAAKQKRGYVPAAI